MKPNQIAFWVVSDVPFTVVFVAADGRQKEVLYDVPLTKKELEEEAKYITFPDPNTMSRMRIDKIGSNLLFIDNGKVTGYLPNVEV